MFIKSRGQQAAKPRLLSRAARPRPFGVMRDLLSRLGQVFLYPYTPKAAVWIRVEATRHYAIFRACNNRWREPIGRLVA